MMAATAVLQVIDSISDGLSAVEATDSRCRLCRTPATASRLCDACYQDLPWNRACCPGCAQPQPQNAFCRRCAKRPPPFAATWVPLRFESPVREAVLALKYRAGFDAASWLAALFVSTLAARERPLPELIVPVPLHRHRLWSRGYNQSVLLARGIARQTGIALAVQGLRQRRRTIDQIGHTLAERRRNVRGAFSASPVLAGRHIVLLDDVMTTGATLAELARVAHKAGAASVEAWAIARVA